jgi:hypothetical protein
MIVAASATLYATLIYAASRRHLRRRQPLIDALSPPPPLHACAMPTPADFATTADDFARFHGYRSGADDAAR